MTHEYIYPNGGSIKVTDETRQLTPHTFLNDGKLWEYDAIEEFYSYIEDANYNILDIGAQTGLYTLFAKFLPSCKFYAYEPYPKSIKCLNDNLKLNNITNVETHCIALSHKISNDAILNTCKSHNGLHTMGMNLIRFKDVEQIQVKTDTIDNMFYDTDTPVHFIKMDIEGFEYYILQGAIKTIEKWKPIIQLEHNKFNMKQCNVDPHKFIRFIRDDLNYVVASKLNDEMIIVPRLC